MRCFSAISSVQLLSHVQLFATPWTAARQASLSITNSWSLFKLISIESVMPSNYLILCCPLLLPSVFPGIRVFSNESVLRIRWPKYESFSFSVSPSNEYSGLIFFRMDWLDLLEVQRTLKRLLQHHKTWVHTQKIVTQMFTETSLIITKTGRYPLEGEWINNIPRYIQIMVYNSALKEMTHQTMKKKEKT